MTLIVNGEKIKDSVIQDEFERLRPEYEQVFIDQNPEEQKLQLMDWSRENVIERVLICQEAKRNNSDIPIQEVDSALSEMKEQYNQQGRELKDLSVEEQKQLKENIELQMKIKRITNDICKDIGNPSDEAVREFFNKNKELFKTEEQIRVAHIVKHIDGRTSEAAARQAMEKACAEMKTGVSFEMLVANYSDCPDSGGDLGYITRGKMVEEFEDVVFNLGSGEVSDVFQTRFGFHIAKVYDRKPTAFAKLEEVKDQIAEKLTQNLQSKAIEDFVDQLKSKAKIEQI